MITHFDALQVLERWGFDDRMREKIRKGDLAKLNNGLSEVQVASKLMTEVTAAYILS